MFLDNCFIYNFFQENIHFILYSPIYVFEKCANMKSDHRKNPLQNLNKQNGEPKSKIIYIDIWYMWPILYLLCELKIPDELNKYPQSRCKKSIIINFRCRQIRSENTSMNTDYMQYTVSTEQWAYINKIHSSEILYVVYKCLMARTSIFGVWILNTHKIYLFVLFTIR